MKRSQYLGHKVMPTLGLRLQSRRKWYHSTEHGTQSCKRAGRSVPVRAGAATKLDTHEPCKSQHHFCCTFTSTSSPHCSLVHPSQDQPRKRFWKMQLIIAERIQCLATGWENIRCCELIKCGASFLLQHNSCDCTISFQFLPYYKPFQTLPMPLIPMKFYVVCRNQSSQTQAMSTVC